MPDLSPAAFPQDTTTHWRGLSARQWFAGQALVSMQVDAGWDVDLVAKRAVAIADAMLRACES